jgi:hypothetical protein
MLDATQPLTASILPNVAQEALMKAAEEARWIESELKREIYMSEMIDKIKREYPKFFKD